MKLSSKVLLGFFGFIFLYLSAAFTELRITGTPNAVYNDSVVETVNLSGVSHIVINDLNEFVKVVGSNHAGIEVRSASGGELKKLKYQISGDTLTLSDYQSDDKRRFNNITVFVSSKSLKGITVNRSSASIEGLHRDALLVSQSAGRTAMLHNKISNIQVELSNRAYLSIAESTLDTLLATVDGAELAVTSPVTLVRGAITNNASMRLGRARDIQIKEDERSYLHVSQ